MGDNNYWHWHRNQAEQAHCYADKHQRDVEQSDQLNCMVLLDSIYAIGASPMRAAVGVVVVLASPILLVWSMGLWHCFHGTLHDSPLRDVAFYPLTSIVAHVVGVGLTILIIPRLWDLVRRGSPVAMRWLCRAASSLTRAASRHRRISLTRT
ncbi:hypothetical protein SAMN05519104_7636 [Rhizobiales bacterium GAS188]|nr:hypothetical protein SAMN05519104_7636 [Rhizobiales bacterium GAS188]